MVKANLIKTTNKLIKEEPLSVKENHLCVECQQDYTDTKALELEAQGYCKACWKIKKDKVEEILKEEKQTQELENYKAEQINWIDNEWYDSWDKCKGHMKRILGHMEVLPEGDYDPNNPEHHNKLFFLAHQKNKIYGKVQLVENVKKRIPMIREVIKKTKDEEKNPIDIIKYFTFDERYDKRYDGYQTRVLALDFWIYRLVYGGTEYYIYSQEELGNESYELQGMLIRVDDFAELSRSLRLKSLSNIFILQKAQSTVRILSKEKLIALTKELKKHGFREKEFFEMLAYHPSGNYNRFSEEYEALRGAQLLSGKADGYPLHTMVWGPTGTCKTMGILETTDEKFQEEEL